MIYKTYVQIVIVMDMLMIHFIYLLINICVRTVVIIAYKKLNVVKIYYNIQINNKNKMNKMNMMNMKMKNNNINMYILYII